MGKRIFACVNLSNCSSKVTISTGLDFSFSDTSLHLIFRDINNIQNQNTSSSVGERPHPRPTTDALSYFLFSLFFSFSPQSPLVLYFSRISPSCKLYVNQSHVGGFSDSRVPNAICDLSHSSGIRRSTSCHFQRKEIPR